MFKIVAPFAILLPFILSGCQNTNDIDMDLPGKNAECALVCSTHYKECDNRFTMMPIRQHNDCTDAYRYCVKACPPKDASTANPSDKPSVTDKLKELDSMHKSGLITDSEYAAKRQEILKGM